MLSSLSFFCDECGAANAGQATVCFACNRPLNPSLLAPTIQTAITPVASMTPAPISTHSGGPLRPGTILAQRYRIEEEIGQGGFGIVYKAKDNNWNMRVAIKQINLRALNAKEIIEATDSYNREVKLLSTLKHPNLPRIYDHFTDPEHWYLVMDFIEGETLERYLEAAGTRQKKFFFGLLPARKSRPVPLAQGAGRLRVREVLDIGIQLCTVLNYLHTRQPPIIFRDVKPANIMLNPRGHIYLIDFGIARHFTPGQARDTGPLGSPGYAAPEQYGKAQTTVRTDIYGLGATLLTLLTGKDPLELSLAGEDTGKLARHKIPKKLQRLLDRMLERDIRKRPKTMREVHKRLERIKLGIRGLITRFSLGLLIGSMPLPILALLSLLSSLHMTGAGTWIHGISLALYCTWPLAFLAQLIMGVVFLCSASRRIMGLGITIMLVLYILGLFMEFITPFLPSFGPG
jgi:serine/threonine protein kinase